MDESKVTPPSLPDNPASTPTTEVKEIAQPFVEMGERAVELLLARMADPLAPPVTVRLPPTFVHRDSCGCPGRFRAVPTGQILQA